MRVYLFHGCVDRWYPRQERFRNFVSEDALRTHLASRAEKYGPWIPENQRHDVLTVDDSTRGAGRFCAVAREMGHEVMLFVNPQQIVTGSPYFFSLLDAYLDARGVSTIRYRGIRYNLGIYSELRAFRKAAKEVLRGLSEEGCMLHISELKDDLHAGGCTIPDHVQPLTVRDLIDLRDRGVAIENHGWSHIEIRFLSALAFNKHVARARDWLVSNLSVPSTNYAVPFGLSRVPAQSVHVVPGSIFLAAPSLPATQLDRACWNRLDISPTLQHVS
jgi:Polysaccharide deacetylase